MNHAPTSPSRETRRRPWRVSAALPFLLVLVLTILVVSPVADFPLNDDWVYAKEVQGLLRDHAYARHPFSAANTAAQVFWGAAWCAVFGFSFTVLRFSTLALALAAAWAVARCVREVGGTRRAGLIAGMLVLVNPIFLNLSYTFMTDVPFMALSALSGVLYLRSLRSGRTRDVLAGTLLAVAAFWVRQFGILLTLAFAATLVLGWLRCGRHPGPRAVAAVILPWLACGAVLLAQSLSGGEGYPWISIMAHVHPLIRGLLAFRYAFVAMVYLGLFLLPLTLPRMMSPLQAWRRWTRPRRAVFVAAVAALDLVVCLVFLKRLPLLPNMLRDLGTGPLTLRDAYLQNPIHTPVHIGAWWWPVTALAVLSAALLATDFLFRHLPRAARGGSVRDGQTLFLALWAALMAASPCNPWLPVIFDRYLLPALVPVAVLTAGLAPFHRLRRPHLAGLAICAAVYVFSLACLQDYMAWNHARWDAIDTLITTHGADPLRIDGGFEYNGMHTSDAFMQIHENADFNNAGPYGWWILDDTWAVSFRPRAGHQEIGRAEYFSFLGMERRFLLILRRDDGGG